MLGEDASKTDRINVLSVRAGCGLLSDELATVPIVRMEAIEGQYATRKAGCRNLLARVRSCHRLALGRAHALSKIHNLMRQPAFLTHLEPTHIGQSAAGRLEGKVPPFCC